MADTATATATAAPAQKPAALGVSTAANGIDNAQTNATGIVNGAKAAGDPGNSTLTNGDRRVAEAQTNGDHVALESAGGQPEANEAFAEGTSANDTSKAAAPNNETVKDKAPAPAAPPKTPTTPTATKPTKPATAATTATTASSKKPSGGYDQTPVPHTASPGFTVQFTFHKASNLPAADLHSSSSDPYVTATLTADLPTRHKEDPVMFHRTRTIHRSTEPEWNEDWVVANIPPSGFRLKCRLYDEDAADHDDRLGNVTIDVPSVSDKWAGYDHKTLEVRKRMGSKRAYLLHSIVTTLTGGDSITPLFEVSIRVLGRSDPPGGRMYTIGPSTWTRHFSPMIGRLTGTTVNRDERADEDHERPSSSRTRKYDFQANEIQLRGPVPEQLYHRYVEFRPIIGRMFTARGIRGRVLNAGLHKQHERIYNFNRDTEYGTFEACTEQASLQFLRLVHFDDGCRIFTYMISLDGVMRFTETGKEFGIDLLSKHSMHSDVATYIAFSGEFFVRRLHKSEKHGGASGSSQDQEAGQGQSRETFGQGYSQGESSGQGDSGHSQGHSRGHSQTHGDTLSPHSAHVKKDSISSTLSTGDKPGYYQLIIDNDSGTYRPEKKLLPILQQYLEKQFPGLGVVAMSNEDDTLQQMKTEQRKLKKKFGPNVNMVMNRNSSSSGSISSSDESRLSDMGRHDDDADDGTNRPRRSKKEMAWDLLEDPSRIKDLRSNILGKEHGHAASSAPKPASASDAPAETN